MGGEKVKLTQYGPQEDFDPVEWPSGSFIKDVIEKESGKSTKDAEYWQASARWALLTKYNFLPQDNKYKRLETGLYELDLSVNDIEAINRKWKDILSMDPDENDLLLFLRDKRGPRNRKLQWAFMSCDPACQFKLHLHPNIELIHCVSGALHGIRMEGKPMTHDWKVISEDKLEGPSLFDSDRSFYFETVQEGRWLVNEVGSIHKSFTASSGKGAQLLVLWGGRHADVPEGGEPRKVNVQEALDTMDNRLGECECGKWDEIRETFLPESERSKKFSA